jgi:hypothetical protein
LCRPTHFRTTTHVQYQHFNFRCVLFFILVLFIFEVEEWTDVSWMTHCWQRKFLHRRHFHAIRQPPLHKQLIFLMLTNSPSLSYSIQNVYPAIWAFFKLFNNLYGNRVSIFIFTL